MIVKDQILLDIERRNQRFLYFILVMFVVISSLFLVFIGRFDTNPIKLQQQVRNTIDLKFSSTDLVALFNNEDLEMWVDVQLIERDRGTYSIKIKREAQYAFDFKINIDNKLYNLHRVGQQGKAIYDFFKTAAHWDLDTTSPELVQLKINNVFIGIYVMEEHIYQQVRDEKGGYFIRLDSDVILLKRILQQVRGQEIPDTLTQPAKRNLLERYFDTPKLAAYIVFFSLFRYDDVLDFNRLMFRYDPQSKKFLPYLTLESVITSLSEKNLSFKLLPEDNPGFYRRLNRQNIDALLARAPYYQYGALVRTVLTAARNRLPGGR
jgi:hypothetical protein